MDTLNSKSFCPDARKARPTVKTFSYWSSGFSHPSKPPVQHIDSVLQYPGLDMVSSSYLKRHIFSVWPSYDASERISNIVSETRHLAWCRLLLSEFAFDVVYKYVIENQAANVYLQLETGEMDTIELENDLWEKIISLVEQGSERVNDVCNKDSLPLCACLLCDAFVKRYTA